MMRTLEIAKLTLCSPRKHENPSFPPNPCKIKAKSGSHLSSTHPWRGMGGSRVLLSNQPSLVGKLSPDTLSLPPSHTLTCLHTHKA